MVNSEQSLLPKEVELIWILDRIPSQNICIMHTIGSNSPTWLFLDKFYSSLTSDDFLWPDPTSNNFEYQFPTKLRVEIYVYLIYFDQPGRFDGYWTDLTLVSPLMTFCDLIWLQIISNFKYVYLMYFDIKKHISQNLSSMTHFWSIITFVAHASARSV